jgi:DNA-binding transcriptional regulator YiaG
MPKPKKGAKGALQSNREAVGAEFWSKRSSAFSEGHQKYPDVRGHWNSITDVYNLFGSEEARSHFVVLAETAAAARPSPRDIELWKLWLAELICLKINSEERPHTQSYPLKYLSDPRHKLRTPHDTLPAGEGSQQPGSTDRVFEGKTITVHRLFEASALLCDRLGSEARADASRAGHPTDKPAGRNTVDLKRVPGRKPGTVEIDGNALKQLRKHRELTQKAFARVLKISDDTLGRIERSEPVASDSSEQVIKICKRRGWISAEADLKKK